MALTVSFQDYQNLNTGEVLRIQDNTGNYDATDNPGGYGTPNIDQNDVTVCRFIFSDKIREDDATTVTSLTAYREYENDGDAAITVDGKSIAAGATFIPVVDVSSWTEPLGYTGDVKETGKREVVSTFLPTDTHVDFTPSQLGFSETKFPDRVYNLQYEVYSGTITTGNIAADSVYLVESSTSTDRVTYNGSEYRPGEVFTGVTGVTAFTTTGSPTVTKRESFVFKHFGMWYYSNFYWLSLILKYAEEWFTLKCRKELVSELMAFEIMYNALVNMTNPNKLNITKATYIIEFLEAEYTRLIDVYTTE